MTENGETMNRRDFLFETGGGLGGIALACLLGEENAYADGKPNAALNGGLHHTANCVLASSRLKHEYWMRILTQIPTSVNSY